MVHSSVEDMNEDHCSIFGENMHQTAWEQVQVRAFYLLQKVDRPVLKSALLNYTLISLYSTDRIYIKSIDLENLFVLYPTGSSAKVQCRLISERLIVASLRRLLTPLNVTQDIDSRQS